MELSWLLVFKIGASLAGVLAGIGMFSELPWPVKLKVTATLLLGIILIGFLAPLGTPVEPFGVISVPTFGGAVTLAGLAVLVGFIGYFLSWPYGREIGILAVPAGLAIWAVRGGNMAELMRLAPTLAQRQVLFAALKWEPIFWLAIVAAGFGGVLIGQKIIAKHEPNESQEKSDSKANTYLNVLIAVVGSVFIAQFCIGIFAQDVRIPDHRLGSVMAQPAVGQIVFAVLVSFGIAAFLVKKFLDASYIWPIAASALVTGFAVITYIKEDTLQYLVEHHPPIFFSRVVTSILPVQMVAFGVLGSIAGYWLVVCYNHWRKHP
jgi:general stress protein CsbA